MPDLVRISYSGNRHSLQPNPMGMHWTIDSYDLYNWVI